MKRFLFASVVAIVLSLSAGVGRSHAEYCSECGYVSGDGWSIRYCWQTPC